MNPTDLKAIITGIIVAVQTRPQTSPTENRIQGEERKALNARILVEASATADRIVDGAAA